MKVNKKDLLEKLSYFSLIKKDMTPPILSNIKMVCIDGFLTMTGNDGINTVMTSLELDSEDFAVLVPYNDLLRLVKSHKPEIELSFTKNHIKIVSKGVKNQLVLGEGGYMNDPVVSLVDGLEWDSTILSEAIKRASSMTGNSLRPDLNSVYFSDAIVGTGDSRHIAITSIGEGLDFILGINSVGILSKNIKKSDVTIFQDENYAVFKTDDSITYCRKMNVTYPNYRLWLGDDHIVSVRVNKSVLKNAIQNCIITDENYIELNIDQTLKLSTFGNYGNSDIEITGEDIFIEGTPTKISVNSSKFLLGINGIKTSKGNDNVYFEVAINGKRRMKSLVIFAGDYKFHMAEVKR